MLAPVMLPDTLISPPKILPMPLTLPAPNSILPPVMLLVTLTVVPVCVVALTFAPPSTLPAVMLPVALIVPVVRKFPACTSEFAIR